MAEKSLVIPKASVKRIMKLNDEVANISADSIVAMCRATELFVAQLVELSKEEAVACGRKTIKVEDIQRVVDGNQLKFEFLNDAFSLAPSKR